VRLLRELRAPLPQHPLVAALRDALGRAGRDRLRRDLSRVESLGRNLAHLDPARVLERGYAIVARRDGPVVTDAARLAPGDALSIRLSRGAADATVTGTRK
jgi:exodeoxyribonuclease VII large subunit